MSKVTPVILCGGSGSRLWPLSRASEPKQFHPVKGHLNDTFFQNTVARHMGDLFAPPVIVGAEAHAERIVAQLGDQAHTATMIFEPVARNTGPAVLAAACILHRRSPDQLMLVVPSDHIIEGDLNGTIQAMMPPALAGRILSFGIEPDYPETGFGYIVKGSENPLAPALFDIATFVEKPPLAEAEKLLEDGALWASGLSMFSANTLVREYESADPATVSAVTRSISEGHQGPYGLVLGAAAFSEAASGPTESVVFEKSDKMAVASLNVRWSDVGSWAALSELGERDDHGNVLEGEAVYYEDTTNCYVRGGSRIVSTVGVQGLVIVDTEDAVLVASVNETQKVKAIVNQLKKDGRPEALLTTKRMSDETLILDHILDPAARLVVADHLADVDVVVLEGQLRESAGDATISRGYTRRLRFGQSITLINMGADTARVIVAPSKRSLPRLRGVSA